MVGGVLADGAGATYVKPPGRAPLFPAAVTTTSAAPEACWPVAAVMVPAELTATSVAIAPPMLTVAPAAKFAPVIVTKVPPSVVPLAGAIAETTTPVGRVGPPPHETDSKSI